MDFFSFLGFLFWGLVTLSVGGVGIYMVLSSLRSKKDAQESLSWPYVIGEVTNVRVDIEGDQETGKIRTIPIVEYQYEIDSKEYSGNRISFGQLPMFHLQQTTDDFIHKFPPGAKVKIYYDPTNPQRSVLKQEALRIKTGVNSGVLLIMIMLVMICALIYFLSMFYLM